MGDRVPCGAYGGLPLCRRLSRKPECRRLRGLTGVYPCAVGSHATLSAVGRGVNGGRSPLSQKIETFYYA